MNTRQEAPFKGLEVTHGEANRVQKPLGITTPSGQIARSGQKILVSLVLLTGSLSYIGWFFLGGSSNSPDPPPVLSAADIGYLGGNQHQFTHAGFNNLGQATGGAFIEGTYQAVISNAGTIQPRGTLKGYDGSRSYGLNDRGEAVGSSYKSLFGYWLRPTRACLWKSEGGVVDLGVLPGFKNSRARAINEKGQVVGHSYTPGSEAMDAASHACLWENGIAKDLGVPPGFLQSSALAINNQGQVVGTLVNKQKELRAFLWERGSMKELPGLPGATMTMATAINERGQAVGVSGDKESKHDIHLVRWDKGVIRDLGTISGARMLDPVGINDAAQVAVNASAGWGRQHTYLWEEDKGFSRLRTLLGRRSGYDLMKVLKLNSRGDILVGGRYKGGPMRAFVLSPLNKRPG